MSFVVVVLLAICVQGCAAYITLIESRPQFQVAQTLVTPQYCQKKKPLQVVQTDSRANQSFLQSLAAIQKKYQLSFLDQAALLALFQTLVRPDASNHFSRLQIVYGNGKSVQYRDYHPTTPQMEEANFLYGLYSFLKENQNRKSVFQLARIADRYFPANVLMTGELRQFVRQNRELLKRDAVLAETFFRLDKELQEGETLRAFSLAKFASKLRSRIKQLPPTHLAETSLFAYQVRASGNPAFDVECSDDINRYHKSPLRIYRGPKVQTNVFGLYQSEEKFFLAITSSVLAPSLPLSQQGSYSLGGVAPDWAAWVCLVQKEGRGGSAVLASVSGRDPGQHLFHLLKGQEAPVESFEELIRIVRAPRSLLLDRPQRILFERERASDKQLEEMLRSRLPLYYAPRLGEVWGVWREKGGGVGVVTDDRHAVHQTCH